MFNIIFTYFEPILESNIELVLHDLRFWNKIHAFLFLNLSWYSL